jgi:exopolysaccharide biosynthesis polyprenyl glycosylphosphotransferase
VLGGIADLPRVLREHSVDLVVVVGEPLDSTVLALVSVQCGATGIPLSVDARAIALSTRAAALEEYEGLSLLNFATTATNSEGLVVKRLLDIAGAATGLLVLAPVFALVALLIKLDDGGPVFFSQDRVALYGRRFRILKFRSMVVDAEDRLDEVRYLNEFDGPAFKSSRDPRVTRFGALLRRFSLDELPQLVNVLRGEMSLVGPRPPLPEEVANYEPWQLRRMTMRPGLTCLWQVSDGPRDDFQAWMRSDLEYIDRWSLGLDLALVLKTLPVVLQGRG